MLSNRFLNASVVAGKSVKAHYDFLQPLIGAFKALKPPIHEINSHMLALMGPKQRQGQVAAVLDLADDDWRKARAIAGLGAGLAALEQSQREALVTAALGLADEWDKSLAIAGLGAGLMALKRPQQQELITAALRLPDGGVVEVHKTKAIAGLGAGLAALEPLQREALVTAALGLADEWDKTKAIAGLGAGLAALEPPQQQALVTAALELGNDWHIAKAIAGLVNGYQDSRGRGYLR
jgi:hypothetical protein